MRSQVFFRGTLEIQNLRTGKRAKLKNELVGMESLIMMIAGVGETIDNLRVLDTGDVEILAPLAADSVGHTTGDEFAHWRWVLGAGVGTGDWDDITVETPTGEVISQFIARNAELAALATPMDNKAAGDSWLVTYELIAAAGAETPISNG